MGRPKASQSNLRIAEAFASAVTLPASTFSGYNLKGCTLNVSADTLFAVLAACIPSLIRDTHERYPANRDGITSAELRKHLIRVGGYLNQRCRRRKSEMSGQPFSGMLWSNRRWVDFNDPSDRSQ